MEGLGDFEGGLDASGAQAVSADGLAVVGSGTSAAGGQPFRWTPETGLALLEDAPGFVPYAMSADAGVLVGAASGRASRWTPGEGLAPLPEVEGYWRQSSARAVSPDGQFVVGSARGWDADTPVRWTPWSAARALDPDPIGFPVARAVSGDGRVVGGEGFGEAFVWDAARGYRALAAVLSGDYGVDLSDWYKFYAVTGISADGRTLVGTSTRGHFWLRLPAQCADGLDNDADGLVDFPVDPDCSDPESNVEAPDSDGDWWLDAEDNCPTIPNPDQADDEADGVGDACEHLSVVLRVPGDYPTIQSAIDAAADGNRVVVDPGVYAERIDFLGKRVNVESRDGPEVTVIDGEGLGPVARFVSGEGRGAALRGFTLRGGWTHAVEISWSGATVEGNRIRDNLVTGGAIQATGSLVRIRDNAIEDNGCTSAVSGGGIAVVGGTSAAEILANRIARNCARRGAGIYAGSPARLDIRDNRIFDNVASEAGGGIYLRNGDGSQRLVQNLVYGNRAPEGGGIEWVGTSPEVLQNTVVGNDASVGSGLLAAGGSAPTLLANNVVVAPPGRDAVHCAGGSLIARSNLVFASEGRLPWGPACSDPTGSAGNLSADPAFVDPETGDFRPGPGSPVIDAGSAESPWLAPRDISGRRRVIDGDGDGTAIVDIGAFERRHPSSCGLGFEIILPLAALAGAARRSGRTPGTQRQTAS
jgi:hypothetical protein